MRECGPQVEPALAQPCLITSKLRDVGHVSKHPFLHLEEGSGNNTPKCYEEKLLGI